MLWTASKIAVWKKLGFTLGPKTPSMEYSHILLQMAWPSSTEPEPCTWQFVLLWLTENENTSDMMIGWKLRGANRCKHWALVSSSLESNMMYHCGKCLCWSGSYIYGEAKSMFTTPYCFVQHTCILK
jgi:hypothetical protein